MGSSGSHSTPSFYGRILNETLGLKLKLIVGYPGQNDALLAMERGELDGYPSVFYNSLVATRPNWLPEKKVKLLVQYGAEKEKHLPNVPFIFDLVKNEDDRKLWRAAVAPISIGRPYLLPPGVPQERVDALRKAFWDAINDPDFLAEQEKARLGADTPRSGKQIQDTIEEAYKFPSSGDRPAEEDPEREIRAAGMLDRNQSHDVQRLSACESIARELLAKADGLVPVLRDRAPEAEALRRCPDATIRDFVDSGLLRACQPAAYGGHEMGYDVLCAIIQRLAQGCASQAWVYMVLADNPLKLATFSKQAQDDVWAGDATTRIGIAVAAVGVGKPVEGGVLWSGRHGFVSGIDHADWLICGGFVEDGGARRGCMVLMPKSEVEVIDDWHVVGLAGTGSKTFVAKDVFVPAHRMIDKKDYDAGTAPGAALYDAPDLPTAPRRRFGCELRGRRPRRRAGDAADVLRIYGPAKIAWQGGGGRNRPPR